MLYANIVVDIQHIKLDRTFTYRIPDYFKNEVKAGMRVLVPFGQGSKMTEGIIMRLTDELSSEEKEIKLKEIQYLLEKEPSMTDKQINLVYWLRDRYLCKYIDAIRTILPSGLSIKTDRYIVLIKKIPYDGDIYKYLNKRKKISLDYFINKYNKDKLNKGLDKKKVEIELKKIVTNLIKDEYIEIDEKYTQNVNIQYKKYLYKNFIDIVRAREMVGNRAKKQLEILNYLENSKKDKFEYNQLLKELKASSSSIKSLEEKNLVRLADEKYTRDVIPKGIHSYEKHELNYEQLNAFNIINSDSKKDKYLLKGVTGSGKTEVYLQLIEEQLKKGKDAIVLVPEISLTPQTVERFVGRFGNKVAIYHSSLSFGERYDEWRKIKEGEVKIVVGTRSALFSPFSNLGIIIIDEEHENSYKSDMNPKYDSIEVSEIIALQNKAKLVLGSATPSIKSFYKSDKSEYELVELKKRVKNIEMPNVKTVDMRRELINGNKNIFSYELYKRIVDRLSRNEQVILFINSRGFSKSVSCRECGYTVKCDSCDISMTYHDSNNIMICHYCGQTKQIPKICPECNSKYIKHMGIGTQRVEIETRKLFKDANIARIDADTMSRKGSYKKAYDKMKSGETDILIGTQMISKGLDFPNVTLVGVIMADISLNIPDYSSSERTFQLITQVAGRAGRTGKDSDVIIQTYNPDHYSIVSAEKMDYDSFYNEEIKIREAFNYPPFSELIDIMIYGTDETKVMKYAEQIYKLLYEKLKNNFTIRNTEILGPNMAIIYKIKDRYRWKVLIKTSREEYNLVKEMVKKYCLYEDVDKNSDIMISIDINPRNMM